MAQALVNIVMGSASDWPVMESASEISTPLGMAYDVTVSSVHRASRRTAELSRTAAERGVQVVIGVPLDSSPLNGMDALLAEKVARDSEALVRQLREGA